MVTAYRLRDMCTPAFSKDFLTRASADAPEGYHTDNVALTPRQIFAYGFISLREYRSIEHRSFVVLWSGRETDASHEIFVVNQHEYKQSYEEIGLFNFSFL